MNRTPPPRDGIILVAILAIILWAAVGEDSTEQRTPMRTDRR